MGYRRILKKAIGITLGLSFIALSIGCSRSIGQKKYSIIKLNTLRQYIESTYFGKINEEAIVENIYKGYVDGLGDSSTYYLTEDEVRYQEIIDQGNDFGTGIKVTWAIDGRYLIITEVATGSPAERVGIEVGDKILEIDGIKSVMANQTELYEKLGYVGSQEQSYVIEKYNSEEEQEVVLKPETLVLEEIETDIIEQVGYIQLKTVKEGTSQYVKEALFSLEQKDVKGIILDVRDLRSNNIDEIYKICDLFVEEVSLFKLQNKQEEITEYIGTTGAVDQQIVVLINGGTAKAAEALVMGLEQHATLVGAKTYGGAEISELILFDDGTGINVATNKILDRNGESYVEDGILPDIETYTSQEAIIELLEKGTISREHDSALMAGIECFE